MKSIFCRRIAAASVPRAWTMGSTSAFRSSQSAIWLRCVRSITCATGTSPRLRQSSVEIAAGYRTPWKM
jgi:hypothetical protein